MRIHTVDSKDLLLPYLFRVFSDTKKTPIRKLLKHKCVSVNDRVTTRHDHPLMPGDQVSILTSKKSTPVSPPYDVRIVYEDDFIFVANKPAGLLTIATEKVQKQTVFYAVNEYLNRKEADSGRRHHHGRVEKYRSGKKIFIVHRLDKDTSGLIVFAKNQEVKFHMQENWKDVRKRYYAIVEGCPRQRAGTIESFLRENKILRVESSSRQMPDSKYAVTRYRVLEAGPLYSFLEIELETGRKHQIRVHLAGLGCPVAGDKDYGSKTNPAGRLALHAHYLAFEHPVTGEKKEFQCELPIALKRMLGQNRTVQP